VRLFVLREKNIMTNQIIPVTPPPKKDGWLGEIKWIAEGCHNNKKALSDAVGKAKSELKRWEGDGLQELPSEKEVLHVVHAVYGIEDVTDPDNWEEAFPRVGDCKLPKPEVIVDELLLKGCIHVWAGMFESYKTMATIELCAAILDNRPAFDHFTVRKQYPIVYLCPDMSPELFQEYVRPFGLMENKDFRWQKPTSEVFYSIDSPVLQRAVEGRILVLDTMLDYAQIQKAFESGEWIAFFKRLRGLINVNGCVAIVMLVHPTKTGARSNTIDPSEYLKDSVTFGGRLMWVLLHRSWIRPHRSSCKGSRAEDSRSNSSLSPSRIWMMTATPIWIKAGFLCTSNRARPEEKKITLKKTRVVLGPTQKRRKLQSKLSCIAKKM
jgi:hypothetical protein